MSEKGEGGGAPRNLVLCSDGTGNRAGKGRGTNVWRLYDAVERRALTPDGPEQFCFYDDGVGSGDNKLSKILGGAFGFGLARNIRQLYSWLVRTYRPGDRIYLFGFSRGAFTVRCLAGMIAYCGILDPKKFPAEKLDRRVTRAWLAFKKTQIRGRVGHVKSTKAKYGIEVPIDHPAQKPIEEGGKTTRDVTIHFMGVWDTVDAYGLPVDELKNAVSWATQILGRFAWVRFSDRRLSPLVRSAAHAVSIDDERHTFHPVLWDEGDKNESQEIDQVWFSGVHSDVGGGYAKGSLALVSLDWMMSKAEAAQLRFLESSRKDIEDKMDSMGPSHNSRAGMGVYYRYRTRDVERLCAMHNIEEPKIHSSVEERIRRSEGDLGPQVLPAASRIADSQRNLAFSEEARDRLRIIHWWRRIVYFAMILWTAGVVFIVRQQGAKVMKDPEPEWASLRIGFLLSAVSEFIPDVLARSLSTLLKAPFWTFVIVASFALLTFTRVRMMQRSRSLAREGWRFQLDSSKIPAMSLFERLGRVAGPIERRSRKVRDRLGSSVKGLESRPVSVLMSVICLAFVVALGLVAVEFSPLRLTPHHQDPDIHPVENAMTVPFETNNPGRPLEKIFLEKGKKYSMHIKVDVPWKDGSRLASPEGLAEGASKSTLSIPFRRQLREPWFVLMATVGSENGERFVFADLPRRDSNNEKAVNWETGSTREFVAPATGHLHLFVNDTTSYFNPKGPWVAYEDNEGSAQVTIDLIDEKDEESR